MKMKRSWERIGLRYRMDNVIPEGGNASGKTGIGKIEVGQLDGIWKL
jgi:hypothetical protein